MFYYMALNYQNRSIKYVTTIIIAGVEYDATTQGPDSGVEAETHTVHD